MRVNTTEMSHPTVNPVIISFMKRALVGFFDRSLPFFACCVRFIVTIINLLLGPV
jgi:hypothetical protein